MISHNHQGSFGSRVSVIKTDSFICTVCTAKEGLFKGLSTVIVEGDHFGRICAKILCSTGLRKADRQAMHQLISESLDKLGNENLELRDALDTVVSELRSRGAIHQAYNFA